MEEHALEFTADVFNFTNFLNETWGAGIASQKQLPIIGLEDIAPIVTYLLHLDFEPEEGILYPGIVK